MDHYRIRAQCTYVDPRQILFDLDISSMPMQIVDRVELLLAGFKTHESTPYQLQVSIVKAPSEEEILPPIIRSLSLAEFCRTINFFAKLAEPL